MGQAPGAVGLGEPGDPLGRGREQDPVAVVRGRDAQAVLTDLAEQRNPIYAEAHYRVQSHRAPHDATIKAILVCLEQWSAEQP